MFMTLTYKHNTNNTFNDELEYLRDRCNRNNRYFDKEIFYKYY